MEKIDYDVLYRRAVDVLPDAQEGCHPRVTANIESDNKVYSFNFILKQYSFRDGIFYYWQFNGLKL